MACFFSLVITAAISRLNSRVYWNALPKSLHKWHVPTHIHTHTHRCVVIPKKNKQYTKYSVDAVEKKICTDKSEVKQAQP